MIYILTHKYTPYEVFTDIETLNNYCTRYDIDYATGIYGLEEWEPYHYEPSTKKNSNNSTSDSSEEPEN